MSTLSKSIKLGVIILALQLLGELNFVLPRLIRKVAGRLGVSRKGGYQAAQRIRELLGNPPAGRPAAESRRELLLLKIRNQVLTFERDHPEVRFADRHDHLPQEAKALGVRLLRDFQGELSQSEIAQTIGVALSSLRRWESEADPHCQFSPKPERRGLHRHASPLEEERVIAEYQALDQSMTLEAFTEHFNQKYPASPLDRSTITRILEAHGLRKIETRLPQKPYHPSFKVYFPGAQAALDGTECKVIFSSAPDRPVTVTQEVAIDIASLTVLGEALEKEENAVGVGRVVVRIRQECAAILAILSDNGSANRSEKVRHLMERDSELGQVFSFPYHPQTNGHLEGLFGQFSRIAGKLEIDDRSKETLAFSIVRVIWRIFIHFHNHSPRERLGGLSPLEYLRRYAVMPAELEQARAGLKKQAERSRHLRQEHPRLSDPNFRSLVERVLNRHRLEVPLEEALRALLHYDRQVIENASAAFFIQTQRDGFDERKRTFAYFMGIVRNKQKELDEGRLRAYLEAQKTEEVLREQEAARQQVAREKAQEAEDLRRQPERVVLQYARLLLAGGLRLMRRSSEEGLRRGLQALKDLGRSTRGTLDRLAGEIRSWGKYGEDLKERMVKLLFAEYQHLAKGP